MEATGITEIITAAVLAFAGLFGLFKVVAKFTDTPKDDEIASKIEEVTKPFVDSFRGKDDSSKS